MNLTTQLFPTNGVHIVPTHAPAGFSVGSYDAEGFVGEGGRWFPTFEKAEAYAKSLQVAA